VCFQSIGKSILETIEETHLLLLVGVCVIGTVAGKLHEMSDIFAHRHGSLLQILELLLELDNTLGHVMRSKSHLKLIPIDVVEFFMSSYIGIPPINWGGLPVGAKPTGPSPCGSIAQLEASSLQS
jgi:hypothetical protein